MRTDVYNYKSYEESALGGSVPTICHNTLIPPMLMVTCLYQMFHVCLYEELHVILSIRGWKFPEDLRTWYTFSSGSSMSLGAVQGWAGPPHSDVRTTQRHRGEVPCWQHRQGPENATTYVDPLYIEVVRI